MHLQPSCYWLVVVVVTWRDALVAAEMKLVAALTNTCSHQQVVRLFFRSPFAFANLRLLFIYCLGFKNDDSSSMAGTGEGGETITARDASGLSPPVCFSFLFSIFSHVKYCTDIYLQLDGLHTWVAATYVALVIFHLFNTCTGVICIVRPGL